MAGLMPKAAAEKLLNNDPSLKTVKFANNSLFQMKTTEYAGLIANGIKNNTHCTEMIIDKCGLTDADAVGIAQALRNNKTLKKLALPNNKLGPIALTAIAELLKVNRTIQELNLNGNSGSNGGKWGDQPLTTLVEALEGGNTTLIKIVWRLDNRISWKITKLLSRNVEIGRRKAQGMDVSDIDPNSPSFKKA
uniref:Uncharacterized protein n=1 Tax=Paramoeba aestuarina TaxID=180227 RepID=A0A7S4PB61_9EUKA|mmetsp:Transcript_39485/g.62432  ORF Transcript_39485/g.62432 Transcript_39485/m.62432 type:complete len:192 (+) Transcript_39485:78-653(+)|eukprot:CAMPEP_0201521048 /NCGR_PEP_ID=MMETSP0161_2-20130828/13944_1 /ASSEMBLY_ACC=CAM_ASM_000251 /TAXON_ID=180227 /ORGANISM="Neoparamoeba aestuarina, Strain SoJaBio B1-5/56/2" /LENGTH=191 /DNA_ID=CAMNT_0047919609 /DNA_START=71 /DNA_END=646 /DNA_ORIENTATION=-